MGPMKGGRQNETHSIQEARAAIDSLDADLLGILHKRLEMVDIIGELKEQQDQGIADLGREREIKDRLTKGCRSDHRPAVEAIYNKIFRESQAPIPPRKEKTQPQFTGNINVQALSKGFPPRSGERYHNQHRESFHWWPSQVGYRGSVFG